MFQDYLFYGADVEMRYAYRMAHLSNIVQYAQTLHELNSNRSIALGDTFLGCLLLSSVLIDEERLNLRIRNGSEFLLSAETVIQTGEMKGFIEAEEGTPSMLKMDAGQEIETDYFVRTLRSSVDGRSKVTEGNTSCFTNSIEDAINDHIAQSYQVKGRVWLQSWISPTDGKPRAFGAVFMELPGTSQDISRALWGHVSKLPTPRELFEQSDDPDFLATKLIPHTTSPIKSITPKWSCSCSQSVVENMLLKLPESELLDMIEKAEPLSIKCHYCSQKYTVEVPKVSELLQTKKLMDAENSSSVKN